MQMKYKYKDKMRWLWTLSVIYPTVSMPGIYLHHQTENGLFLFQWDSLAFSEFKIQVGVDEKFEDSGLYFDLPQGNRWIADKELVPLAGELPGMAMGLMRAKEKNQLYWRVIGRQASGRQAVSGINRFSITPVSSDSS